MPHPQGPPNNTYPDHISSFKALCVVSEQTCSYSERLLASRQTPKLEGHYCLALLVGLFHILAANLQIWRPSPQTQPKGICHEMVT